MKQIAEESLRHRVRTECEMAQKVISTKVAPKLLKQLKSDLQKLNISYGAGGGVKLSAKRISTRWLVGQINRTLNRLLFESNLGQERRVLLLALTMLEAL